MTRFASLCAPWRTRRIVLALVTCAAVLAFAGAHAGQAKGESPAQRELQKILAKRHYWEHRLAREQRQESLLQQQLTSTGNHLSGEKKRLQKEKATWATRQAALDQTIATYQSQIDSIRNQLSATRTEYARVHKEASRLLRRLKQLRARIARESGNVRQAIVEMYQLSQISPLETVLEAKNLSQFLNQQDLVDQIGSHDAGVLRWAEHEHVLVHEAASAYLNKMADLRALQAQERTQLHLVIVETQHEDLLLIQQRQSALRRQAGIRRTEASIRALARQEQGQLQSVAGTAMDSQKAIEQDQQSAEKVAWIIAQQTGQFPYIGGGGSGLQWPVVGPITQGFGPSPYPFEPAVTYHGVFYPHFHTGIDIAAPFQTPVHAAAAGKIIFAGLFVPGQVHASYGLVVIIMHNRTLSTLYAHLDIGLGLKVHVGEIVSAGQVIGYEGVTGNTTGPHLHFEVRVNGVWVNPLFYLPKEPSFTSE